MVNNLDDLKPALLANPEISAEYDAMGQEFAIARLGSGRTLPSLRSWTATPPPPERGPW